MSTVEIYCALRSVESAKRRLEGERKNAERRISALEPGHTEATLLEQQERALRRAEVALNQARIAFDQALSYAEARSLRAKMINDGTMKGSQS